MTLTPGLGSFRGGSLPNVSEPKRKPQQSSTVNTEEIKVLFFIAFVQPIYKFSIVNVCFFFVFVFIVRSRIEKNKPNQKERKKKKKL